MSTIMAFLAGIVVTTYCLAKFVIDIHKEFKK